MAFVVQFVKNNRVVWTRQWATTPTFEQVESVTIDDGITKGGLYCDASKVYRGITQMIQDAAILQIDFNDGSYLAKKK